MTSSTRLLPTSLLESSRAPAAMATQTITKSVTATDTEVAGLWTAYLLVVAMLVVPNFILIHPYLHLLILGPLLVWIGCQIGRAHV